MERKTMVGLLPQAKLIREKNKIGVSRYDCTVWSKDDFQAALLCDIANKEESVDELKEMLHHVRGGPLRDEDAALILAEFILTFENMLKN